MDLENLRLYIQKQIEKLEKEINESTSANQEFENIKNILYSKEINYEDVIQYIIDSKYFQNYSEPILKILNDIKLLKDLLNQIKNNLENIDIESFQWHLSNNIEVFNDLEKLKKLYKFAINPNFKDEELKKNVFLLESRILEKINFDIEKNKLDLKKIIESIEIKILKGHRTKDNIELLEKLKSYLDICNKEKVITTEKELKSFFEFIKQSNLSKDTIYRLIISFSKSNIVYYNNLIRKKLARDKSAVQENKRNVHKQIREIASEQSTTVQDILDEEIQKLTEEEKCIYDKVEKLLENYDYDSTFYELFKDNYSLEDRIGCYGTEEIINFEDIKSDFVYILKPNLLGENKEKIFSIFNYILELNEKYLENQKKARLGKEKKEAEKRVVDDKIKEINKMIEPILRKHNHEIETLNNDEKYKNLCKQVYEVFQVSEEDACLIVQGLPHSLEYYKLQYIINEINESYEYIKSNELSLKDAEYMYDNLRGLVIIYEEILTKLPKDKKEQPNYEYDGKNFVCLMNDSIDYSIPEKKAELLKAITFLKNYEWHEIVSNRIKNHLWGDLTHTTASGKDEKYTNDLFSVGRMRAIDSYRTGMVVIRKIAPENKEKIKKRYNLSKVGVISFIFDVIYVEATHKEYADLVNFVNNENNMATINYYVSLFGDPNTPEEKLFEILDKGIIDCEKINSNQSNIGGAVYE